MDDTERAVLRDGRRAKAQAFARDEEVWVREAVAAAVTRGAAPDDGGKPNPLDARYWVIQKFRAKEGGVTALPTKAEAVGCASAYVMAEGAKGREACILDCDTGHVVVDLSSPEG